ncbi:GlxA family transcriptional regulator [Niabella insulamsoli]|uniref:GlxA family transcriptional regulator n=1 Tax=Niabella insulamsoli TaxID=3144874 RepID=UPI0031FC075F
MKMIYIVVPEHAVLQAVADPQYCFNTVNEFLQVSGKEPLFKVQLVGEKREVRFSGNQFSVTVDQVLSETGVADLVIVPALFGEMTTAVSANAKLAEWIVWQYKEGAEIASLCVGAFLLASTGLLNGKKCSTHWGYINTFRDMFPDVIIQDGSIVTEQHRVYTSGGASSYWNLLLHLVEKYTDRQIAILVSKYFAIDIDRSSQSAFAVFTAQKNHNDEAVRQAQDFIEQNIEDRLTIDDIASHVALGRRSLERRFKHATNNSVLEYIQRVKIEAAKKSFESSRKNINEVMYDVGYTDTKAFRSTFKKITGLTPIEYKNKYNKLAVA